MVTPYWIWRVKLKSRFSSDKDPQFYVVDGELVPVPSVVVAHGSHDQSSHGNWAHGGAQGDIPEVTPTKTIAQIMEEKAANATKRTWEKIDEANKRAVQESNRLSAIGYVGREQERLQSAAVKAGWTPSKIKDGNAEHERMFEMGDYGLYYYPEEPSYDSYGNRRGNTGPDLVVGKQRDERDSGGKLHISFLARVTDPNQGATAVEKHKTLSEEDYIKWLRTIAY